MLGQITKFRDDIGVGANSNKASVATLPMSSKTMIAAWITSVGVAAEAAVP